MSRDSVKNVLVVGAGAMGCLFAARMLEAGARVTLVDVDGKRLRYIDEHGLELVDDRGTRLMRPSVSRAADFDGPVDLVVLFTKAMHSRAASVSISHIRAQAPLAITLQNGLGNAEALAETFGADRVLVGTAMVPADLDMANRVVTHGFSTLHFGGLTPCAHLAHQPVAELLRLGGFDVIITPDPMRAVWEKLAFNAALNPLAMITSSNNGALNNPIGRRIASHCIAETVAVAAGRGIHLDAQVIEQQVSTALARHPGHEASMLQDRKHDRMSEIDSINRQIIAEGLRLGVAVPVNAVLADLVSLIEARYEIPDAELGGKP